MNSVEAPSPLECRDLWIPLVDKVREQRSVFLESAIRRTDETWGPSANLGIGNEFEIDHTQWEQFRREIGEIPGVLGIGRSRLVIEHPIKPDRILSVAHDPWRPWELDRAIKLNEFMHMLFPDNFPQITDHFMHGLTDSPSKRYKPTYDYSGFEAERIFGPESEYVSGVYAYSIDYEAFRISFPGDKEITSHFKRVLLMLKRLGIYFVNLGFDFTKGNFMLDEKGREMYVELLIGQKKGRGYNIFGDRYANILRVIGQEIAEGRMDVDIEQVELLLDDLAL